MSPAFTNVRINWL